MSTKIISLKRLKSTLKLLLLTLTAITLLLFIAGFFLTTCRGSATKHAQFDTTNATIKEVEQAIIMFRLQKREYPTQEEGFQALIESKALVSHPKDAWGNDLVYTISDDHFDVISYGPDGIESEDDLSRLSH